MSTRKGLLGRVFIKWGSGLGVGPAYSLKIEHLRQMDGSGQWEGPKEGTEKKTYQSRMSKGKICVSVSRYQSAIVSDLEATGLKSKCLQC